MSCLQSCVNKLAFGFRAFDSFEERVCQNLKGFCHTKKESIGARFNETFSCIVNLQSYPDRAGSAFTSHIVEPLSTWNEKWLERPIEGSFPFKVVILLVKAPICAVRNIVELFYSIIKNVFYACVHPIDAFFDLLMMLVDIIHTYVQIETASKSGAAMIGASIGQALIIGNPVSIIAASLGAFILLLGLTIGPLKAAVFADEGHRGEAALENLIQQLEKIPEMFFTGLLMGLFLGGIQKVVLPTSALPKDPQIIQSPVDNLGLDASPAVVPPSIKIAIELAVSGIGQFATMLNELEPPEKIPSEAVV